MLDACSGTLDPCGGDAGRDADRVLALTRANAALAGIGLAGLATGGILLGVGYSAASSPQVDGQAERASFRMGLGLGAIGLEGRFR